MTDKPTREELLALLKELFHDSIGPAAPAGSTRPESKTTHYGIRIDWVRRARQAVKDSDA